MAQFHVLLDIEYQLYDLMVKKDSKEHQILIDDLLEKEHQIYKRMTREEFDKNLFYLQNIYLNFKLNGEDQVIYTRFAKQLDLQSCFYEMQEFSSLSLSQMTYLGLNPYFKEVMEDYLFYQRFYKSYHQKLKPSKVNDYLYSFLYANYADMKDPYVPSIQEEEFLYHGECSSIFLEDFHDYCNYSQDCSSELIEAYLKVFPKSFSSHLYSLFKNHTKKNQELFKLFQKNGFEDSCENSFSLPTYQSGEKYSFDQFQSYQEYLEKIKRQSSKILPYIKNVFYQMEHGDEKDIEESYLFLLKNIIDEEKSIREAFDQVDDGYAFKCYVEDTQLRNFHLPLPLLLSLSVDSFEEVSEELLHAIFLKRFIKKATLEMNNPERMEKNFDLENENNMWMENPLEDDIFHLQEVQNIILSYLKKEITEEQFYEWLEDLKESYGDEFDSSSLKDIEGVNMLHYLMKILFRSGLQEEQKEKVVDACALLIYMHHLERDVIKADFHPLKPYLYNGDNSASKIYFNEIKKISHSAPTTELDRYFKSAYINGLYLLLSKEDRKECFLQKAIIRKRKM